MSDAIREALEALDKLYVAEEREDRVGLYNTVKASLRAKIEESPSVSALGIQHPYAIRSSIKMLRERFEGKRCDSDGVSGCIHCNIMFLCIQLEKLLANALQSSQTAPAVPDEVREAVSEAIAEALGDAMDCTRVWSAWGVGTMSESDFVEVASDPERVNEIAEAAIMALIAAPQPDNSPDAGKVVQGEPVGIVEEADHQNFGSMMRSEPRRMAVAETSKGSIQSLPKGTELYTHPAESREEIQAQALDGVWDKLYDMADERSASDPEEASGIMTAVNFIKGEAASLRASQQEGGEG